MAGGEQKLNTMTPDETALFDERGFLMCPKCGGKMRHTEFHTLIQGWDDAIRTAVKVQYTGDKRSPTQTIEQPPTAKPSEVLIKGAPMVACHKCNVLKIHPDVTQAVEWTRRNMLPARNRDTIPWEVVTRAMAEQQSEFHV